MKLSKKTQKLAKLLAIQEKLGHDKLTADKDETWRERWAEELERERQSDRSNK